MFTTRDDCRPGLHQAGGANSLKRAFALPIAMALAVCAVTLIMSLPAMGQPVASQMLITTVVGTGTPGYSGDNGPAISALLQYPRSVALDSAGNLYIADSDNNRIRVVNTQTTPITVAGVTIPAGDIATVAGSSIAPGYGGDGGPATSALLYYPWGLALDSAGNIYIADSGNSCIRVVNTQTTPITIASVTIPPGDINTVAGICTSSGLSGDSNAATSARLDIPWGVALDSAGNIYIADSSNARIRVVNTQATPITIAGATINPGYINTVVGSSPGFSGEDTPVSGAQLNAPIGVALDAAGNLYIADQFNNRIRVVNTQTTQITIAGVTISPAYIATVAGSSTKGFGGDNGPATSAALSDPYAVTLDSTGNLYIADYDNCRVRKVDTAGVITTVAGNGTCGYSGDNGPATSAELNNPLGVTLESTGSFYIADNGSVIRKVEASYSITEPVSPDGGTVSFIFQNDLYNIVYQYPAGFVTAGSTLTVTAFQTSQAQWALRTPVGNPYHGTQLAPVDGLGGDGIIYEAVCKDGGGNPCALHPELSYTITTSWDGPAGDNQGFLKAPIGTNNWENVFVPGSYFATRTDIPPGPDPTGGGKSNGGWSDWAFVYNVTPTSPAPTVSIITPAETAIYGLNEVVYASYACSGSYVAACVGDVASGYPIDTTTVGSKTFTVVATVTSGQSASQTVGYTVEATHACLLYDPSRSVKSGAAYPIKVYLCDASGNNLSSPSIILHATSYTQKGGSASTDVMDAGNSNPDNDFRFSSDLYPGGGYIFNYKTTGLHGVYELNFTVTPDATTGASHSVGFEVR